MNRLPAAQRILLYAAFLVLLATGVLWESVSAGPWASALMKVHGAAAMVALVLIGTLIAHHIPAGWGSFRNRWSGVLLLTALGWLVASGYLLYYSGSETLRSFASQSHLWVGLAGCMVAALHLWRSAITSVR
ncbi:MAG: hypothetical protein JO292_11090 [Betaproteobacteria bacterium]|nr:hypothetical protein [Betaproteobacteria bacterium]MBV9361925.1 hypothetical protein [Betaproteobacteria bacterium]